jgi:hypothetical protein
MTDVAELMKEAATCVCHTPGLRGRIVAALAAQAAEIKRLKGLLDTYQADCNALREARRLGR